MGEDLPNGLIKLGVQFLLQLLGALVEEVGVFGEEHAEDGVLERGWVGGWVGGWVMGR